MAHEIREEEGAHTTSRDRNSVGKGAASSEVMTDDNNTRCVSQRQSETCGKTKRSGNVQRCINFLFVCGKLCYVLLFVSNNRGYFPNR